jgi:hypothetical protein
MANGNLHAPLIDLLTLGLWAVAFMRHREGTWQSQTRSVRALDLSLAISAAAVISLEALGLLKDGNVSESLWQVRHLLLLPVRASLLMRALDGTEAELRTIARLLIALAVVKSLVGIYFLYGVVYPMGGDVEYTTSHTDTLLFVPVLAMFFNRLVERFSVRALLNGLPWFAIVALGLVCNDRRLAYVCLACAAVATLALTPSTRLKRALLRATLCVAPFMPPYLLAGWSSTGGHFFFVARLFRSLVAGDPNQGRQADYRDLENLNVLFTWKSNAIVPYGFGHKMQVLFPLPDISRWFPSWQYHPHNQYLWLLAIAGPVGFTLIVLPQIVTLYLATRAHRQSARLVERTALLTALAIVISFFCQVYGDMGSISWTVTWMAALAAAVAGKLGRVSIPAGGSR